MENSKNNDLIVGDGVKIVGEVDAPGKLELHGRIEGSIRGDDIKVGSTGVVEGSLHGNNVDLQGSVSEQVTAQTLILRSTAVVSGSVQYQSVEIESGAEINGTLSSSKEKSGFHGMGKGEKSKPMNLPDRIVQKDEPDADSEARDDAESPEK
ncbi:polymer-forming cytoskeletal protein [Spiribacter sp. 2438]|uniref:bactofilin family protein n=1 Tax=Spiribacter sp. 2438 TaxID=2666185 RepID=UPI0012B05C23|nr:polymer-forming cytoskeletal protein [Spiribacter sp. 2438]QGM21287.1 polymer-forming cytoskeletal protein [Spiribacter sp. 2438]